MANYQAIHGTTVRNSAGNLSGAKEGELFYDSTNLDFKYQFPATTSAGAWRTGGDLNQARSHSQGGGGVSNSSAMWAGGYPGYYNNTELYDGATWTEVNNLNN